MASIPLQESPFLSADEREREFHARDTARLSSGAPEAESHSPKQSLYTRIFDESWGFEVLLWFVALLSLVVILVILGMFNGQPLQNWHSGLTVNTLLHVLSQIAQSAVFVPVASSISQLKWIWYDKRRAIGEMEDFDKASRGLIDSLRLIMKRPKWILVYLGAVSTSLILLLGPFAQQSVSLLPIQRNEAPGSGYMLISTQYQSVNSSQRLAAPNSLTLEFDTIAPQMQVAVTSGLLTTDASPSDIKGTCQTGNCTFEDYSSLAICSSVDDVTPTLIAHCPPGYSDTEPGCDYTVPDLQNNPTWRKDYFKTIEGSNALWIGASQVIGGFPSGPDTLVEFFVLYLPDVSVLTRDTKTNFTASLVAFKGALNLCVQTYRTNITNGDTSTTVKETQKNLNWQLVSKTQDKTSVQVISATDAKVKEYWMEQVTRDTFNRYLAAAAFFGEYSPAHPQGFNHNESSSDAARGLSDRLYNGNPKGMQGMSDLLANVATSMSNALRTTSDHSESAPGTATYFEIHISVNFRWLIIPILSIVLAFVFLIAVIAESRRKHIPAWKSDQIAVLFAIEPEMRARMERLDAAQVKDELVVLERKGPRGWQLRGSAE
ncbi:hypothetical protein MMC22_010365 [Lobaria immixta]|nr:hypothetical protein [Lobaria immixta]